MTAAQHMAKFDWKAIVAFYNEGHSVKESRRKFHFSMTSWKIARESNFGLRLSPTRKKPWQEVLVNSGRHADYTKIKRALIESGRVYACEDCGTGPEWNGKKLTIQIDHVNGDSYNHSPDNVKFRCPNCHSQTPNYGNKGGKRTSSRKYRPKKFQIPA